MVDQRAFRRALKPQHELMNEVKNTQFNETELEKIFMLVAVDQARARQLGQRTRLQVRKIPRKVGPQIKRRRRPGIIRPQSYCHRLGCAHPVGALAIDLEGKRHFYIEVELNQESRFIGFDQSPGAALRMRLSREEKLFAMVTNASGRALIRGAAPETRSR
jgi:hypothetical protein